MAQVPPPKRHPYDQWSPDSRALDLVGDKWTLLIVRDLASGPRRFVELQRVLPGISTEQLRSRLNRMVADGMLTRKRYREVPPRVDYELTDRARDLMPILAELARWGHEWAWGTPREGERVDIGAIFRLAPGLVPPAGAGGDIGDVELSVLDGHRDGGPLTVTVMIGESEVRIREAPAETPSARASATTQDWVRTFSPGGDGDGLDVEGDRALVQLVLDALAMQGERVAVRSRSVA